jgi:AraC family transcriptional regulator of adaptative response / DNA-3-methyladenine glycosylase II
MMPDDGTCYRALCARDARFDGLFFVGVTTTGVYCRPVCPARTPGPDRCAFFRSAAEAERAGFRACFRCRPELAPGGGAVDARPRLVSVAVGRIEGGFLDRGSVDDLAAELGVTGRHLRRAMRDELGLSPVQLAQSCRLALAKRLVQDSSLSLAGVAFASGFSSVRRFNAVVRARLGAAPSALRRGAARAARPGAIALRVDYRPPLDWGSLLGFLGARATPGVEAVGGDGYRRSVRLGAARGWVEVRPWPGGRPALAVSLSPSLAGAIMPAVARLRRLFDLDAHPALVADHLAADARLAGPVASRPGLRVPGAFDGFEVAVRAVLGQQISVRAATTLAGRLAAALGEPLDDAPPGLARTFPGPAELARAGDARLGALGLPAARARALVALARAVEGGTIRFDEGVEAGALVEALEALPGFGEWTANYVAMRALPWPDALPAGDLVLRKALGARSAREVRARAEPWRPWRAYGALHLWAEASAPAGG